MHVTLNGPASARLEASAQGGFAADFRREDTLAELLLRRATEDPDFVFAIFPDETETLAGLRDRALAFARRLTGLGLKPRDHVAILMPNCLDFMVAHLGTQLAGGISVLPNARYRSHELLYVLKHSDARFLVTSDRFAPAVDYAATLTATYPELGGAVAGTPLRLADAPLLQHIICFGPCAWPAASAAAPVEGDAAVSDEQLAAARAWQSREDMAVMYYTSGTTSLPKGCEITHAGLQRSWSNFTRTVGLRKGEKVWVPMPFFHSGGVGLMAGLMAAGCAMASAPVFDPNNVLDMIEQHRIEILYPGFHLLAAPILESPRYSSEKFGYVRVMPVIGPHGTLRQLQARLPAHAVALNLYGMSEASGLITMADPDDPEDLRLTWCGRVQPGMDIAIADPETGELLEAGQKGEILFRDGGCFKGYYKDPETTQKTIRPDGFVRSGDMGVMDTGGRLAYTGRIKDMLRIGGENVAAAEIESFISQHPGVANVQVIAKPDDRLGDVAVAFVERKPGSEVSGAELIAFCQGRIARFKVPKEIRFVAEWPMSATKIQKFKLKDLLDTPPDP